MHAFASRCAAALLPLLFSQSVHADGAVKTDYLKAPDRIEWDAGALYDGQFDDGTRFHIELAYPRPDAVRAQTSDGFRQKVWQPAHYKGTPSSLLQTEPTDSPLLLSVANAKGSASDETYAVVLDADRAAGHGVHTGPGSKEHHTFTLRRSLRYAGVMVARPAPEDLAATSDYARQHGFVFTSFFPVLKYG